MVSFSLRQRILFTSPADTRSVSFHLSQFAIKTSRGLRLGCAANKRQLARLANSVFCESAVATHFPFALNRSLVETLFRDLSGNTVVDSSRMIFRPEQSARNQADNLPICILPVWLRNIE
jgi:hypothetical protein